MLYMVVFDSDNQDYCEGCPCFYMTEGMHKDYCTLMPYDEEWNQIDLVEVGRASSRSFPDRKYAKPSWCPRVSLHDLEKHLREIKGVGSAKAILIMDSIRQYVRGNEHEK